MEFHCRISCNSLAKFVVNVVCFCLVLSSHGIEGADREIKVERTSHDRLNGFVVDSLQEIRTKLVANGIGLTPQMG